MIVFMAGLSDCQKGPESSFGLGIQNWFLGFEIFAFVLEVGFDFPFSFLFLIFSSYVFLH